MLLLFFTLQLTSALAFLPINYDPYNLEWFGVARRSVRTDTDATVCVTTECQMIAKIFKESMNKTADPCENFYEYACGNWPTNNPVPPNEDTWSFWQKTQMNVLYQVLEMMKTDSDPEDMMTVKLAKRYYRACEDEERREELGLEPVYKVLGRIGGWPMIMEPEEWSEDIYTWQKVDDYYARLTGENALHAIDDSVRYRGNQILRSELTIKPPTLPNGSNRIWMFDNFKNEYESEEESEEEDSDERDSQEYGSKEDDDGIANAEDADNNANGGCNKTAGEKIGKIRKLKKKPRQIYADLVAEVATAIAEVGGVKLSQERLSKDIDDMLTFIHKLEMAKSRREDLTMSLLDFHEWYNGLKMNDHVTRVNWVDKIMLLFEETDIEIDSNYKVKLSNIEYFDRLTILLRSTPRRTIVNYIHWRFITDAIKATTKKMEDLHRKIIADDSNARSSSSVPDFFGKGGNCIKEIEMIHVMCYVFVKKHYPKEIQEKAEEMLRFLQKEVEIEINQSEWINEETKKIALGKVHNIDAVLGFPDWYNNATIMENEYKGLVVGTSHFENTLSYRRYKMQNILKRLQSKNAMEEERERNIRVSTTLMIPLILNAMYSPFWNKMVVTAADFQNPLFALSRPPIMNYGLIGTVIGHEINHGFDTMGYRFDKYGVRYRWNSTMEKIFLERVQCFIDQFDEYVNGSSSYSTGNLKNFGQKTKDENIADTMGLEATLGGYYLSMKEENDTKPVQTLPGLKEFSPEQLFFLSYSIMHCESEKKSSKVNTRDPHSSGRLRVIGALSNSETFGKSFNCPIGSPMNPEKKCNIWN